MKYNIKGLLVFLFLLLIIAMFGCKTPQQRLNRLYKNHPELFTKDTVFVHDTVSIQLPIADTKEIDSLLALLLDSNHTKSNYNIHNDSVLNTNSLSKSNKKKIADKIGNLYKNKPCISAGDSLRYTEKGITVKVWQVGDKLKIGIDKQIITDKAVIKPVIKEAGLKWYWWLLIIFVAMLTGGFGALLLKR
jgi:hypothetical protein